MPPRACITNFLTDGSLIRLCESAERITGVPVAVRDASGRLLIPGEAATGWSIESFEPSRGETGAEANKIARETADEYAAPLRLGAEIVGELTVSAPPDRLDAARRDAVRDFLEHLAQTVSEVCQQQNELRRRVDELGVLYRLSSMLVGATSVDAVVDTALRSVVEVLGVSAGSVRILDEEQRMLQLRASVNLSDEYIRQAGALPADRICDSGALCGEVVLIPDISKEDSFLHPDALVAEGVRAMASVGLIFRDRGIGLLRLYLRDPDEMERIDRDLLQSVAQQIAAAVANARLLETEAEADRVRQQLKLASDVQKRMLPTTIPQVKGVRAAARYDSSFELGGDFYDLFDVGGHLGVVVGDVVGKGVAAALLMSSVRATLRAHAQNLYHLDEIMSLTNQALCRDTHPHEFATVFHGVVDPESRRLTYCNAGHEPPVILRVPPHRAPTTADLDELPAGGMVLGVDPSQRYQRGACELQPGDVVLLHSDGMTDAMNFDGQRFGKQRMRNALLDALAKDPNADAEAIADHLLWELRRFVGLNTRTDDTTIVVLRLPFEE